MKDLAEMTEKILEPRGVMILTKQLKSGITVRAHTRLFQDTSSGNVFTEEDLKLLTKQGAILEPL
jgi:hypothetical protein